LGLARQAEETAIGLTRIARRENEKSKMMNGKSRMPMKIKKNHLGRARRDE